MKCLVTGSSGFIGSHLVKALIKAGHKVEGLDSKKPKFHGITTRLIDITNTNKIIEATNGFDFVFHLAGLLGTHELVDNAYQATLINIGGTVNVLEACKKSKSKLILASKPNCWLNAYSITKIGAENFVKMYRKEHGVKAAIVKWFNVYGPYQPLLQESGYRKFIPHALVDALRGDEIKIYGSGHQTMDLVHTDDTINAVLAVMNNWDNCEGKVFEAGHHKISVNEVTEMLLKLTNNKSKITHLPMRKGEPEDSEIAADTSLLRQTTNWVQDVSLEDGLRSTLDWYKKYYKII